MQDRVIGLKYIHLSERMKISQEEGSQWKKYIRIMMMYRRVITVSSCTQRIHLYVLFRLRSRTSFDRDRNGSAYGQSRCGPGSQQA